MNSNILGSDRTTWVKDPNNNVVLIAYAGGDGIGFNPGGNRPKAGGSGAGAAWGGCMGKESMPGIQSQHGKMNNDGFKNTIWAAGEGNIADGNIANRGGRGLMNIDTIMNNCNIGLGGGGGAGNPGSDATLIKAIDGNDMDGNPIGPLKGGKGGDGILCTLPGIKNFTYNGKNWGQLYWAGGGGASFSGYYYDRTKTFDYNSPTKSADGGKGGGGGGHGPLQGNHDTNGLNPANDNNAYTLNSGGNTGGAGGINTGGGGGGGFDSGGGGEGGSGIIIISFVSATKQTTTSVMDALICYYSFDTTYI
jgi:hypothetical protein